MTPKNYTIKSCYNGHTYHYQRMSAGKHYGSHASGSVLLSNGVPTYHASPADVTRFIKEQLVDAFDTGHTIELAELAYPYNLRIGLPPTGITYAQAMQAQVRDMISIMRKNSRKPQEPSAGSATNDKNATNSND